MLFNFRRFAVKWTFCLIISGLLPQNVEATNSAPRLEISGDLSKPLTDNIISHLNIARYGCGEALSARASILRQVDKSLQQAAKALGYYHLQYTGDIQSDKNCWVLRLNVTPGEPVRINNIDVAIFEDSEAFKVFDGYLKKLPVKPGDQLNHAVYENIKTQLSSIAANHGYFKAKFAESKLLVNTDTNMADIVIHYQPGPRIRFGKAHYPQTVLSENKLHRYDSFNFGEFYSSELLSKLQRNLDNSNYFSEVSVRPLLDSVEDNHVPIEIKLIPRKRHAYRFGIGITTDTGPRGRATYENRYLNRQGHKLNYDLSLSPVRSETNINYTLPLSKPASEHLDIYAGLLTEDTDSSDKDVGTLGAAYTRQLSNGWLQTIFLNFQREEFSIANDTDQTDLLTPGISWSKTQTQDPLYPLNGWRLQTRLRGSSDTLASDASFTQIYLNTKAIKKIGPGRLLARLELGTTDANELATLPASIRFFAGGDNSVRGYDYQELGATDTNGDVIGGTQLATASLEYDMRINRSWAIAAFYDQGNAFDSIDDAAFKRGAGIGLRWLSPIGPIRLDIAKALDDDEDIRIHISMGPDL